MGAKINPAMDAFRPFFSVVIPTYNRAHKLKRALQSVLSQQYTDFEILVMDDGSIDNTFEVVKSFGDSRIHYEWEKNAGGPARPRNRGIKKANGEWICFLDSDDVWYINKLETCYRHINDKVDLIYHDLDIEGKVDFLGRKVAGRHELAKPILIDLLINGNSINNSSVIVRKHILEQAGYIDESPDMIAAEDYNMWLKISVISENFCYIPKVLGRYILCKDSISKKDMSVCSINASSDFTMYLNNKQLAKYNSWIYYSHGRSMYLNKEYNLAMKSLFKVAQGGSFELYIKSLYMIISGYSIGIIDNLIKRMAHLHD